MTRIFAIPERDPCRALTPVELENAAETFLVYGREKKKPARDFF